ncbi:MAG: tail fiber domain-containing protein [Flavobacteriales bacterium]|nr:tail fiber domain-containing protein [Flavobacteriales bacterium]
MKKREFLGCIAALSVTLHVSAQDWTLSGNSISGSEWFGADGSSTVPLQIRHDANYRIEWYTDAIRRMLLRETATYTLGSFPGQVKDGSLLICPKVDNFTPAGPFSLLHLAAYEDNSQEASYRPWMNIGVTFTGNMDHSYVGQKPTEKDYTDMVVHWSDNPGEALKDRLRFIFTSGHDQLASTGAQSEEGLEAMRIFPARFDEAYVGIGDFYAANLGDPLYVQEPTERVDIVNGRLRVRDLPGASTPDTYRIAVVDNAAYPSDQRGVVKAADVQQVLVQDCEWTMIPGPFVNHVYTAVGTTPSSSCPDDIDAVGVGVDLLATAPWAKFNVNSSMYYPVAQEIRNTNTASGKIGLRTQLTGGAGNSTAIVASTTQGTANGSASIAVDANATGSGLNNGNQNIGLRALVSGGTTTSRGVYAVSNGGANTGYGGEFIAHDAAAFSVGALGYVDGGTSRTGLDGYGIGGTFTSGVAGRAEIAYCNACWPATLAADYVGVRGRARRTDDVTTIVGVYGQAAVPTSVTTGAWAGWFDGDVNVNGSGVYSGTWTVSDQSLKTNVESISGAMDLIAQLQPKTYDFDIVNHPAINLQDGLQRGFIAQELEQVLPELVKEVTYGGRADSTGTEVMPGETVKAVNYIGLIPVMVAAMQEQTARIAQLEQQLASCCTSGMILQGPDAASGQAEGTQDMPAFGAERALRIVPNPFVDRTTLYFSLERAGRAQLLVNSADGRDLRVLSEAQREPGDYQHEWDTTGLAPGVYYVTLLLDGEPAVKRAVKVQR